MLAFSSLVLALHVPPDEASLKNASSSSSLALLAPAKPKIGGGTLFEQMHALETTINEGVTTMNHILTEVGTISTTYEEKMSAVEDTYSQLEATIGAETTAEILEAAEDLFQKCHAVKDLFRVLASRSKKFYCDIRSVMPGSWHRFETHSECHFLRFRP